MGSRGPKSSGVNKMTEGTLMTRGGPEHPTKKAPGRKPGCTKPPGSGAKKGVLQQRTLDRQLEMANAMRAAFQDLLDDEKKLMEITPLEIMRRCAIGAIRGGQFGLAVATAEKWAPYVHAKLATKYIEPEDAEEETQRIIIQGGLPDATVDDGVEQASGDIEIIPPTRRDG